MNPVRRILIAALALTQLAACAAFSPSREFDVVTEKNNLSHVHANCDLVDFTGKLVFHFSGSYCLPKANGDIYVFYEGILTRYDSRKRSYWEMPIKIRKQVAESKMDSALLTIQETPLDVDGMKITFDALTLISETGKVIKKFNLGDHLKNAPEAKLNMSKWQDSVPNLRRGSHAVRFIEITKTSPAGMTLVAYLAADTLQRKLFILSPTLTAVTGSFTMENRFLDVVQANDNELILLSELTDKKILRLEKIDLKSGKKEIVFETAADKNEYLSASLQKIDEKTFFVYHHINRSEHGKSSPDSYAEFIDISSGKRRHISLKNLTWPGDNARVINAVDFLKNERYY